jgi:hypothetical protein
MNTLLSILGFGSITAVIGYLLNWVLKKYLTEKQFESLKKKISDKSASFGKALGIVCTVGLTKWKWTAKFWNSVIESYIIIFLEVVCISAIVSFINGIVDGLETDNKSFKEDKQKEK